LACTPAHRGYAVRPLRDVGAGHEHQLQPQPHNLVSPQAAVILKPMETMSVYTAYSISYLPASGDQFSALTDGTLILQPQKFENTEVGMKWNINPKLLFSTAIYNLNRTNQPIADGNNPGFFFPSGATLTRGFEASLVGYVTDQWQSSLGYAY